MTSTLGFMCSLLPELGGASGGRKVPLLDILATSKFLCNKLAVPLFCCRSRRRRRRRCDFHRELLLRSRFSAMVMQALFGTVVEDDHRGYKDVQILCSITSVRH
jgi:hypothetical protein